MRFKFSNHKYFIMKRVIVSVLLFFAVGAVMAQNIQLHYDLGKDRNYLTTTVEKFNPDKYGSTFFFVDFNYSKHGATEAYWEVARELKNWEGPISAHIEYNGGLNRLMSFNNCYLLGATYSYNAADFSKGLSFSAMYKNIQGNDSPHNFQLTAVWYMNLLDGKVSFTGFADFWKEKHTVSDDGFVSDFQTKEFIFLTEPQLWYNFNKNFSAGTEVEISSNFAGMAGLKVMPTLAAKYTF